MLWTGGRPAKLLLSCGVITLSSIFGIPVSALVVVQILCLASQLTPLSPVGTRPVHNGDLGLLAWSQWQAVCKLAQGVADPQPSCLVFQDVAQAKRARWPERDLRIY